MTASSPHSHPDPAALSPSLRLYRGPDGPAREMKFLVSEEVARRLEDRVEGGWTRDPHGDPALGGAYLTTTLYCDTREFDMLRRSPGYAVRKFRIRRYGVEARTYLERKTKWGDRVHKRRSNISLAELINLSEGSLNVAHNGVNGALPAISAAATFETHWPGRWFHRRLQVHRLGPVCQIGYERLAFIGQGSRLTLDRRVRSRPVRDWVFEAGDEGLPILEGSVILEFKYHGFLPASCKGLIEDFNLMSRRVSKYRAAMEAWGHRSVEVR